MRIKKLIIISLIITLGLLANSAIAQQPIGSSVLHVLGIGLTADPSQQTVPINTNTGVNTQVVLPDIGQGIEIPAIPQDFLVMAELTGPGITNPIIITAKPGELLMIPPLPQKGTYILDKIRIVSGNEVILYAEPSTAYIDTIEKLLLTQVTSRPLSIDEIEDLGIIINPDNYTVYSFTVGFTTESGPVSIQLPVAMHVKDNEMEDIYGGGSNKLML